MDYNKIIIALVVIIIYMLAAGLFNLNLDYAKVDSKFM